VPGWSEDLALAHRLADIAAGITLARFAAADLVVETKPDLTPVSDADRAAEDAVRRLLAAERPEDAMLGEERGETGSVSGSRRWIVDPIDGTKNYVRGMPVWATLIALQVDSAITIGLVSAPALGRRWWAARGAGAWVTDNRGTRQCRVSAVGAMADAFLSYSSLHSWDERGLLAQFMRLGEAVWRTRGIGDFWSHMLVAEGSVDISCEPEVSLWDLAALQPIVEEAGGRFSDLSGVDRADGGSVVCTNGLLHDDVLRALAAEPARDPRG
jgi:histidinol-phosphatase